MVPSAPVPHVTHPAPLRRARTRVGKALEQLAGAFTLPVVLLGALASLLASRLSMASSVGVLVQTGTRPGASELQRHPTATYFAVGLTERGDTVNPIEIRSMAEYAEKCGARVTYGALNDDLQTFFAEGGGRAVIARCVGAAATVGTLTLVDRAGSPVSTVRIDAKNAGAWSSQVTVEIAAGTLANTFRMLLRLNGELVEVYNDVATPAELVTAVNARSSYVSAANLGSGTVAPNNNPAVLAATALSAGSDDRAAVNAAAMVAALARFGPELSGGAVAIPGQAASAVGAGVIAHCKANRRIGILAPAAASSVAQAKTEAGGLRATSGSEHAGLFFPWIKVPDGAGGTRTISPEGYIAAVRSRAHRDAGPFRAPAGEIAVAQFVAGVELTLTKAEIDDLLDDRVNAIRSLAGTVRNYGWRSLSVDEANFLWLSGRDVLNYVAHTAEKALEPFVFRSIDGKGHLFAEMRGVVQGIVEPLRQAGGLYEATNPATGEAVDSGYVIDTGPNVNTAQTIAAGEARADVALRVSPVGELIRLTVTKVSNDTSL